MSKKTTWLTSILLIGAGVVMMVRAQDSSEGFSDSPKPKTSLADRLKALRQNFTGSKPEETPAPTPVAEEETTSQPRRSTNSFTPTPPKPTSAPAVGSPPTTPSVSTPRPKPVPRSVDSLRGSNGGSSRRAERLPKINRSEIPMREPTEEPTPEPKTTSNNTDQGTRVAEKPDFNEPKNAVNSDNTPSKPPTQNTLTDTPATILPKVENLEISSVGPSIKVNTVGPRAITLGKPATFIIQAANQGNSMAREIVVAIDLPEWVDVGGSRASTGTVRKQTEPGEPARMVWTIERLAGQADSQLTLNLVATENRPIDLGIDWAFRPDTSNARIMVQQPQLDVAVSGPFDVMYGEDASYTITVSNPGTGVAENVILNLPPEFGGEQHKVGVILAGQRKQIETKLLSKQSGQLAIRVQAFADSGLKAEVTQRIMVRRAKLAAVVDGPKFKYAGTVAKYTFKLTNAGDATSEGLVAAAAIPQGAKFLTGPQGAEQVQGGMRWTVGTLNPGAERIYEVTCILMEEGQNEFQAGVRASDGLQAANNVVTNVEALADLKLTVTDPKGPQPVGDSVSYALTIVNRGTKAASAVNLVLQFSEGIEPVGVDGGRAELLPGQVLFKEIDRIEAGDKLVLTVTAKAEKAGNHVYRTTLKCTNPETQQVLEGNTRFFGDSVPSTARSTNSNSDFEPVQK